ncbi:hypothetical protein TMatcc_001299 [Talaromyces marneffei ATCC 18224]
MSVATWRQVLYLTTVGANHAPKIRNTTEDLSYFCSERLHLSPDGNMLPLVLSLTNVFVLRSGTCV